MPSNAYRHWRVIRNAALQEIVNAHTSVGGSARGRRHTTQQINRAFAVLLASQFQGFCRDLHSECVDHVISSLVATSGLLNLVKAEFTRGRQLDRGNAQPTSLKADFGRLGVDLWQQLIAFDPAAVAWRTNLDLLNEWRNAIAHQDFTSPRLGGIMNLRLAQVMRWQVSCRRLARAMDEVLRRHLQSLTGATPW